MVRETSQQGDAGSSGTSHDRDAIVERVIATSEAGVVLEFDLPEEVSPEARAEVWQFPVRVLRPVHGPFQLLNRPELETRVDDWLKAAKWGREVCGKWIFTWNAFQIECDPQTVIATVEAFDLSEEIRSGAAFMEKGARAPGTITKKADAPEGATFVVELEVDPDAVRHARAESDVIVGEILRKPVMLDAALRERAKDTISGTISITFETDLDGHVRRRTKVTKVETKKSNGHLETEIVTQTLERRMIAKGSGARLPTT